MLEQMLKKLFESDSKAASGSGSDHIKAGVLSRIEMERSMKHLRIKPLIIAAAVSVVGLMSVVLTVNASTDNEIIAEVSRAEEERNSSKPFYDPEPYSPEIQAYLDREFDVHDKYISGRINQAVENGGIKPEKELDDRDVVGFMPYNEKTSQGNRLPGDVSEKELELAHKLEEDPGSLGLIPAGKTETFESGLRIVNRHFENTNEPVDGIKRYYSVRRIYTDDEENKLLASIYYSGVFEFDPEENEVKWYYTQNRPYSDVICIMLDHTENGCLRKGSGGMQAVFADNGIKFSTMFESYIISPDSGKEVRIGVFIAVSSEGIQWID